MKEIEQILREQFIKYPKMNAQDALKLLYQHCFGCEHMLKNKDQALSMLKEEMDSIEPILGGELWEDLGNGYIRLNLAVAKARNFSQEKIGEAFMESAKVGRKADFEETVAVLEEMTENNEIPFSKKDLQGCLEGYKGGVFRHSETYRTLYRPSYRVLDQKLAEMMLELS